MYLYAYLGFLGVCHLNNEYVMFMFIDNDSESFEDTLCAHLDFGEKRDEILSLLLFMFR